MANRTKTKRNALISALHELGWRDQSIANQMRMTRGAVQQVLLRHRRRLARESQTEGMKGETNGKGHDKPIASQLPAHRNERVIEVLEDFAANRATQDIYKVAEELRYLIGEQLAEERRKEMAGRSD